MPLTTIDVDTTGKRMRVMKTLIERAETATDFNELKAVVLDLCRIVEVEVEAGHSAQFD